MWNMCGNVADVVRNVAYDLGYRDAYVRQVITQWVKSSDPHMKERRLRMCMLRDILSTDPLKLDAI